MPIAPRETTQDPGETALFRVWFLASAAYAGIEEALEANNVPRRSVRESEYIDLADQLNDWMGRFQNVAKLDPEVDPFYDKDVTFVEREGLNDCYAGTCDC